MGNQKNPFSIKIPGNNVNKNNNNNESKNNEPNIDNGYYMFNNQEEVENFVTNANILLINTAHSFKEEMQKFYNIINTIPQTEIKSDELENKEYYKILKEMVYYKNLYNIILHEIKKYMLDITYDFAPFLQKSATMEEIIGNEIVLGLIAKGNQTTAMNILTKLNNETMNKISENPEIFGQIVAFKYTKPDIKENNVN